MANPQQVNALRTRASQASVWLIGRAKWLEKELGEQRIEPSNSGWEGDDNETVVLKRGDVRELLRGMSEHGHELRAWLQGRGCVVMLTTLLTLAGLSMSAAQATEPPTGTLTLACTGTVATDDNPTTPHAKAPEQRVSLGVIVDFASRKIHGFSYPVPVPIRGIEETEISFVGEDGPFKIVGRLDRVTGDLQTISSRNSDKSYGRVEEYSLKCKPTQRMF
jgi:hypothetical protein